MAQIIKPEKNRLGVAHILEKHIEDYQEQYPLWPEHRKIVFDLLNCRTAYLGGHIDRCDNCGTLGSQCLDISPPKTSGRARHDGDFIGQLHKVTPSKDGPVALQFGGRASPGLASRYRFRRLSQLRECCRHAAKE